MFLNRFAIFRSLPTVPYHSVSSLVIPSPLHAYFQIAVQTIDSNRSAGRVADDPPQSYRVLGFHQGCNGGESVPIGSLVSTGDAKGATSG